MRSKKDADVVISHMIKTDCTFNGNLTFARYEHCYSCDDIVKRTYTFFTKDKIDVFLCRKCYMKFMKKKFSYAHPGYILKVDFLVPRKIKTKELSEDLGVSRRRIDDLVKCERRINADLALRLGMYFKKEPLFWLSLQNMYDLKIANNGQVHVEARS